MSAAMVVHDGAKIGGLILCNEKEKEKEGRGKSAVMVRSVFDLRLLALATWVHRCCGKVRPFYLPHQLYFSLF